ncbi:MAG: hypothetical protein Q9227_006776 [Pyrenula ochraceoflavens]
MSIRKLDLAARAIDLTEALIHMSASPSLLVKGAWEIGQWLGCEKLSQFDLEECMKKAKGLVIANEHGQNLFQEILHGIEDRPTGPLFLRQSGSLGRLMASDPNLSWLVSTVVCLFQFHRDDRRISETLTCLILQGAAPRHPTGDNSSEEFSSSRKYPVYNPLQIQIRTVVAKIVKSIWYNVVNAGCNTISLPVNLISVCAVGHYLEPNDFAVVTHALYARCKYKAILRSDHLLRDVVLWLMLHYDGLLVVSVSSRKICEKKLGDSVREPEIRVKSYCTSSDLCQRKDVERYQIFQNLAGKFEHFFSGQSVKASDVIPHPGTRHRLNDIHHWYPRENAINDHGVQTFIKCTAQSMVRWFLRLPLLSQTERYQVSFFVNLDEPKSAHHDPSHLLSALLQRTPGILNLDWGDSPPGQLVYRQIRSSSTFNEFHEARTHLKTIIAKLVILKDLDRKIARSCRCHDCEHYDDTADMPDRHGCLRRIAFEKVMILLAHSIADGFGVNDASAAGEAEALTSAMIQLLYELCENQKVSWGIWGGIAASVYLGCPIVQRHVPTGFARSIHEDSIAAIQYGNLAAIAPWIDMSQSLELSGIFRLVGARGRIGVAQDNRGNYKQSRFCGVEGNFAVVIVEMSEDVLSFNANFSKATNPAGTILEIVKDESDVETDAVLVSDAEDIYELLVRVKTRNHSRFVVPRAAMLSVLAVAPTTQCSHELRASERYLHPTKHYSFDELLGRWPDAMRPCTLESCQSCSHNHDDRIGTIHITNILDTLLKRNIALALSMGNIAVQNEPWRTCLSCTLEQARELSRTAPGERDSRNLADLYIINLSNSLATGKNIRQQRRIEGQ